MYSITEGLGAFGWLATRELSMTSKTNSSGNYGYQDMISALKWVNANIGNFGGDPKAVTLYGQSAGGTATMALLAAPSAQPGQLFHRAWMLSGSARYNTTLVEAERDNAYFLASAGCGDKHGREGAECLRAAPAKTIIDAGTGPIYWLGVGFEYEYSCTHEYMNAFHVLY